MTCTTVTVGLLLGAQAKCHGPLGEGRQVLGEERGERMDSEIALSPGILSSSLPVRRKPHTFLLP